MVVIGVIVYTLTRVLHLRYRGWSFDHPKDSALWGLVAIYIGWVCVSALFFTFASPSNTPVTSAETRDFGLGAVVSQMLTALVAFGPAVADMRWRRKPCTSAGASTHNLVGSLVVSGLLVVVPIAGTFFGDDASPC